MSARDFQRVIREAVAYFSRHGYASTAALDEWARKIEEAAQGALVSPEEASEQITRHLGAVYRRMERRIPGHLRKLQSSSARPMGPDMFFRRVETYPQLTYKMRTELDRRIQTSADLIKIRRPEAIAATLRRFKGWAISVPPGGTPSPPKKEVELLTKEFRNIRFETNRLNIDQGHKLNSALNATFAEGTGAIAGVWHSNWRQFHYNYRPDHKERDKQVYAIRGNWALERGLMKPGPAGYSDEITQPAEEVYCRCWYQYLYNLNALPDDMLTDKGKQALEAVGGIAA